MRTEHSLNVTRSNYTPPMPTRGEVCHCQISSWYSTFAKLSPNPLQRHKGTMRTVFINLPDDFVEYLRGTDDSRGLRLPKGCKTSSFLPNEDLGDDQDAPYFPQLDAQIESAIQSLGGKALPKLNWSAPKDALWINGGTLQCRTPGDVYLLLKASDFCSFDLNYALQNVIGEDSERNDADPPNQDISQATRFQLALRQWCQLYPSQEFRCFVKDHELVAISQRHDSQHFEHLSKDLYLMRSLIVEFFDEIVQHKFAGGSVSRYCFDCYIDRKELVWLVDFNVWGQRTDTLLFTWDELEAMDSLDVVTPDIRIVETEKEVRSDPLASYRAPMDAVHLASLTGGDPKAFEALMELCQRQGDDAESDSQDREDDDDDDGLVKS